MVALHRAGAGHLADWTVFRRVMAGFLISIAIDAAFWALIWGGFALLSLSILTTQQHYLADVVAGLASGAVAVALTRWLPAPSARPAAE